MSRSFSVAEVRRLKAVFKMPSVQTMVSRKSSVTDAFVNSLIPVIKPAPEEIAESLHLLGMTVDTICCAYCGDKWTEWDHLRPLVQGRRPTGYISEIANLVPSCSKCNQSKRNRPWDEWIVSHAPNAPKRRGVNDLHRRIEALRKYELWKELTPIDFERILGKAAYAEYWRRLDDITQTMRECQDFADGLKRQIAAAHKR